MLERMTDIQIAIKNGEIMLMKDNYSSSLQGKKETGV